MDDPLLMRVLDRLADRHEQLQPLARRQLVLVAVLGDRARRGPAPSRSTAGRSRSCPHRSTWAMLGWSISARACRSASKRAMTCRLSMPGLMIFSATLRCTGSALLGHVDHAHAPFADLLQQLVRADLRPRVLGQWRVDRRRRNRRTEPLQRRFQVAADLIRIPQERFDPRAQVRPCSAGLVEEAAAIPRIGQLQGSGEYVEFIHRPRLPAHARTFAKTQCEIEAKNRTASTNKMLHSEPPRPQRP